MKNSFWLLGIFVILISCQSNRHKQGERLYIANCAACHGIQGEGLKSLYPPLKNSDYYENNIDQIACIIKHGLRDTISVNGKIFKMEMLGVSSLNEVEITNLVNYMNHLWYPKQEYLSLQATKRKLAACN